MRTICVPLCPFDAVYFYYVRISALPTDSGKMDALISCRNITARHFRVFISDENVKRFHCFYAKF